MIACHIEPELGRRAPTFLYDYPFHLDSLAKKSVDDPALLERFELYIGGLELANGCSELTDQDEQRRRFRNAESERRARGKTPYPAAEPFLSSLPRIPEAAGIALGVDRLAMIVMGAQVIDEVVAFPPETL